MSNLSDRFTQYGLDLASSQSEYLSGDGSPTYYGADGSVFPASLSGTNAVYTLAAGTDISASDLFQLEVSVDQGEWTPAEHRFAYHEIGASQYGMRLLQDGTDDEVQVEFGGDGAEDGTDWSAAGVGGYTRWRVTRVTAPVVGNPQVPLATRDQSTGNVDVGSGFTLSHPNLTVATPDTYTVSGKLQVDTELVVDGDLIVPSGGDVFVEDASHSDPGEASSSELGLVKKNEWEKKDLAGSTTDAENIGSKLTEIGATYRVYISVSGTKPTTAGSRFGIRVRDGSTQIALSQLRADGVLIEATGGFGNEIIYIATSATLNFESEIANGASISNSSYAIIERLNN